MFSTYVEVKGLYVSHRKKLYPVSTRSLFSNSGNLLVAITPAHWVPYNHKIHINHINHNSFCRLHKVQHWKMRWFSSHQALVCSLRVSQHTPVFFRKKVNWMLIKIQSDAAVCRYLFTAKSFYVFRVSQHPSSGVLNTVTAASGTGHDTGKATSLQRGPTGHVGGK